ncbi:uncharacterized protein LOC143294582 [Babylonia areolata]|uniref:uncharacterized protein LOC143294582 n=1 Tax=Babylonia areolata TaxID=304850 RepID=UPI003FD2E8F2
MACHESSIEEAVGRMGELLSRYYRVSYRPPGVAVVLHSMPVLPQASVDPLITACLHRHAYSCAILAAVFYKRLDRLAKSEALNTAPTVCRQLWDDVLVFLASNNRWSCAKILIDSSSHTCIPLLSWLSITSLNEDSVPVFEALLDRCSTSHTSVLTGLVRNMWRLGFSDQCECLVNTENKAVRHVLSECFSDILVVLVRETCLRRLYPEYFPSVGANYNGCLTTACEAGLLASAVHDPGSELDVTSHSAFGVAVILNQPDLVRFLYRAGVPTSRHVRQLSRHPSLIQKAEADDKRNETPRVASPPRDFPSAFDVDAARSIRDFLTSECSRPRSLQSLCVQAVSRQLGWGNGRQAGIKELQIPNSLKNELSFKGEGVLVNPEK